MNYPIMFSPIKIGGLELKNRVVMTAMGVSLANYDGSPSDDIIAYYTARAKGECGLIITEVTRVDDQTGVTEVRQLSQTKDENIAGHKKLTDSIHAAGGRIFCQLHHPGRQTYTSFTGIEHVLSASDQPCGLCNQPTRAMTLEEVHTMIGRFVSAAVRAQKGGYDGVELHAAHGYLLQQFLSDYTNHRTDEFGGSLENRCRIVTEIIDGIHEKCGRDFPISVRMDAEECLTMAGISEKGIHLEEAVEMAKLFESKGVDVLNVSTGSYETVNTVVEPHSYAEGWRSEMIKAVKEAVSIPVMGNAAIRHPEFAEKLLEDGNQDMISMGRTFLADPEWALKAKEGRAAEINKCISCLYCFETVLAALGTGDPVKCALNPCTGHETKYPALKADGDGRKVAVIGGGAAGMKAAVTLAARKFKPVLFEAKGVLGGQLNLADKPPMKKMISEYTESLIAQCKAADVEIVLNKKVSKEDIEQLNPYAVILATGGTAIVPASIPGIDKAIVNDEVLNGKVSVQNKKVVVVGGANNGLETAELLAENGNDVTVIEMLEEMGNGIYFQNLIDIMGRLGKRNVKLSPGTKLLEITDTGVKVENTANRETSELEADVVVLSMGTRSVNDLKQELEAVCRKLVVIGDADKVGRIGDATRSAYVAAMDL